MPRILLVEDSRDQRDLISLALARQGWQVDAASRADEALQRLAGLRYDLVISHLGLPDRAATGMLRDAREAGLLESTAVLIVTGQADPDNPDGFPIFHKPVDVDALVRQAASILGAPVGEEPAEVEGPVELVLYYTPPWPSSMKALRNLETLLGGYDAARVRLSVRDLAEHPDLAETDGVVFSPTLIKRSPGAPVWMLGDLSDSTAITDLLLGAGLRPKG